MITSVKRVVGQQNYKENSQTQQMLCVANNQCKGYGQHQQSNLMALVSIAQEDKMNTIQSWKEIAELYEKEMIREYPEGLWVDPAEMELHSDTP